MNAQHTMQPSRAPPPLRRPQLRREMLRDNLSATVGHLHDHRENLIEEGYIEDYVALHWLEWNGGTLRLTDTGHSLCDKFNRL